MYAPVKEIMTDILKYNLSSDEALLVLCIRGPLGKGKITYAKTTF